MADFIHVRLNTVDTANFGTVTLLFANNNYTKKSVPLFWLSCGDGGLYGLISGQGSTVRSYHQTRKSISNAAWLHPAARAMALIAHSAWTTGRGSRQHACRQSLSIQGWASANQRRTWDVLNWCCSPTKRQRNLKMEYSRGSRAALFDQEKSALFSLKTHVHWTMA